MPINQTRPRGLLRLLLMVVVVAAVYWPPAASAEVVTLLDNTRIYGELVHYFDGELTIKTAGGARVKLPAAKVKEIRFKLPKPRAAFSTPTKTFNRWKQSLLQGQLSQHIECYAMMYQMMMTNMIGGMSKADFEKMVKGHRQTRYVIRGTRNKGKNLAFLKVAARLPGQEKAQLGELLFVKENSEWKLVPPQFQQPQGPR
ncbi:MAG: hypothetical protein ABI333_12750 [bacterium]